MGKANVVQSIYSNQWCWYTHTESMVLYAMELTRFDFAAQIHLTQFTISVLIQFPKIRANIIHLIQCSIFTLPKIEFEILRSRESILLPSNRNQCVFWIKIWNAEYDDRDRKCYSMLIKRCTERPEETQCAFHEIYLWFFFLISLEISSIDSVSCVMHTYMCVLLLRYVGFGERVCPVCVCRTYVRARMAKRHMQGK